MCGLSSFFTQIGPVLGREPVDAFWSGRRHSVSAACADLRGVCRGKRPKTTSQDLSQDVAKPRNPSQRCKIVLCNPLFHSIKLQTLFSLCIPHLSTCAFFPARAPLFQSELMIHPRFCTHGAEPETAEIQTRRPLTLDDMPRPKRGQPPQGGRRPHC